MDPARAEGDSTGTEGGIDREDVGDPAALPASLQMVFASLEKSGIEWCLLRPAVTLGQTRGDIDLLVGPSDRARARELLLLHGFVPLPVGGDLHVARYDEQSDRFLWLHVQNKVRLGGGEIPARAVLQTVRRRPLPQPSDAYLFWIVLLHDVLDKGEVPARHRSALAALSRGRPTCLEPMLGIALAADLNPARLLELARVGAWDALGAMAGRSRRRSVPRGPISYLRGLYAWRGVAVAVMGPDGAGKSTLVQGLRATLPFPSRTIYMGLTGGRLPRADALRVPGLVLVARLALLWARYALSLYHRARGRIVLFDRYTLDGRVPSGRPLGPLARLSRRVQARAVPPPELVLLLDASGTAMHARKGEYDPDQLEAWRAAYGHLRGSARMVVLDAEQPPDAVRREAAARLWDCYANRWAPQASGAR